MNLYDKKIIIKKALPLDVEFAFDQYQISIKRIC
jgi:hypothetical protein